LEQFIRDIINFSKNARIEVRPEPVSVNSLIHETFEALQFIKGADTLQLDDELPDDLVWVTDKTRLQIVFFNLISNAIQYQDKFKTVSYIRISCSRTTNQLVLQIEDNGIGIEQAYQDKVFDMFYRATVSSKGSGLGLYIVKEAVEKLGGTISLRSAHGEGTSFTLSLPLKELNSSASPSEF
jgi:signal transduction histidine kinase